MRIKCLLQPRRVAGSLLQVDGVFTCNETWVLSVLPSVCSDRDSSSCLKLLFYDKIDTTICM